MSLNRKDEGRRWSVTRCNRAELEMAKGNEFALFADNVHLDLGGLFAKPCLF